MIIVSQLVAVVTRPGVIQHAAPVIQNLARQKGPPRRNRFMQGIICQCLRCSKFVLAALCTGAAGYG